MVDFFFRFCLLFYSKLSRNGDTKFAFPIVVFLDLSTSIAVCKNIHDIFYVCYGDAVLISYSMGGCTQTLHICAWKRLKRKASIPCNSPADGYIQNSSERVLLDNVRSVRIRGMCRVNAFVSPAEKVTGCATWPCDFISSGVTSARLSVAAGGEPGAPHHLLCLPHYLRTQSPPPAPMVSRHTLPTVPPSRLQLKWS